MGFNLVTVGQIFRNWYLFIKHIQHLNVVSYFIVMLLGGRGHRAGRGCLNKYGNHKYKTKPKTKL
jgi:hypothetical protein